MTKNVSASFDLEQKQTEMIDKKLDDYLLTYNEETFTIG